MADRNFIESAREDVSGRYRPQEALSHEVIRQAGNVCLWKSTTTLDEYHITVGTKAACSLIPDAGEANLNFEMVCAKQGGANV